MFQDKYVFAQLVFFLNRSKFNRIVSKYKGDRYVKHFSCWIQLLVLMFGQLSNRESLRSLTVVLDAHYSKCYHLGMGKNVPRSSLARANQDRDYHIFEEYPTTWSTKQERRKLSISSISAVTFMLSIRQRPTYTFPCFGGQSSVRIKAASRSNHYMMWKHRFLLSFISLRLLGTTQKR